MTREPIRLAELVAALSLTTDLGMGQPLEFGLQSCLLSLRLGEAMHMSESALREVYYQALLRYIGCNVETDILGALTGDEIAFRHDFAQIDNASLPEILQIFTRFIYQAHRGQPPVELLRALAGGILTLPQIKASFSGHCEVAQRLATRLGFEKNIVYALGQLYERWDGKGSPHNLKGEAIAPSVLVVTLAQDALIYYRLGGIQAAQAVAHQRQGNVYSPVVVNAFCAHADSLFADFDKEISSEMVLSLEPGARLVLDDESLDNACSALADFVDLKSTFTLGHSSAVAELAGRAAHKAGLANGDVSTIKRAGMLHDLGRTGVSSAIWEKTGSLSERDWEQVRLHPYYTGRILAHPDGLARLGALASLHHERLDGSGYYRGLSGSMISQQAQILAAADMYQAMIENRPHRPAHHPEQATAELQSQVRLGCLDSEAVRAVLSVAGFVQRGKPQTFIAGLSEREVEVLRLLARGFSTRQVSDALVISPKTADHHIQHIYNKIGVSTRAGATLYTLEHHLLD